jgi:hypothetical protein
LITLHCVESLIRYFSFFNDLLIIYLAEWKRLWPEFKVELTTFDEKMKRRWIDPAKVRRWFQNLLAASNLEKLSDEEIDITSVIY